MDSPRVTRCVEEIFSQWTARDLGMRPTGQPSYSRSHEYPDAHGIKNLSEFTSLLMDATLLRELPKRRGERARWGMPDRLRQEKSAKGLQEFLLFGWNSRAAVEIVRPDKIL